jgi:hypothetical protein
VAKKKFVCFEVFVNGKRQCAAGVGSFGVLFAQLAWVKRSPNRRPMKMRKKIWNTEELSLDVQGSCNTEDKIESTTLRWIQQDLNVGDEIRIVVVKKYQCDEPANEVAEK